MCILWIIYVVWMLCEQPKQCDRDAPLLCCCFSRSLFALHSAATLIQTHIHTRAQFEWHETVYNQLRMCSVRLSFNTIPLFIWFLESSPIPSYNLPETLYCVYTYTLVIVTFNFMGYQMTVSNECWIESKYILFFSLSSKLLALI